MADRLSLGPVVLDGDRLFPEPSRPGSHLSQSLLLDALFALAPFIEGRVLDVGCGRKPYHSVFARQSESYIGCDWPSDSAHGPGPRADVFADAMHLPFAAEAFDSVVCTEVLEHLPDPRRCTSEIARVLRPGGVVLVSVPFFYWIHEAPRDYYRYTPFGLRQLLSDAGLDLVELRSRGGLFAVFLDLAGKWITHLTKRAARRIPGGSALVRIAAWLVRVMNGAFLLLRRWLMSSHLTGRAADAVSMTALVSLGYVAVARKRDTSPPVVVPSNVD